MKAPKEKPMKMITKNYWKELDAKGKLKYFFLYYKKPVIYILSTLFFMYITVAQLSSISADMIVMIMGTQNISKQDLRQMKKALIAYTSDVSHDHKKEPKIYQIKYKRDEKTGVEKGDETEFKIRTGLGYPIIFVLSPSQYERLLKDEKGYTFRDISDITSKSIDAMAVPFKDTLLSKLPGFSAVPDDYLICMMNLTKERVTYVMQMESKTAEAFGKLIQ